MIARPSLVDYSTYGGYALAALGYALLVEGPGVLMADSVCPSCGIGSRSYGGGDREAVVERSVRALGTGFSGDAVGFDRGISGSAGVVRSSCNGTCSGGGAFIGVEAGGIDQGAGLSCSSSASGNVGVGISGLPAGVQAQLGAESSSGVDRTSIGCSGAVDGEGVVDDQLRDDSVGAVPVWRSGVSNVGDSGECSLGKGCLPGEGKKMRNKRWAAERKERKLRKQGSLVDGKGVARETLERKWAAENELACVRAQRKLEVLLANDVEAEIRRYRTGVCRSTEQNMVRIEEVHGKLRNFGNVTGESDSSVHAILSQSSVSGSSISPGSSASAAEFRAVQKEALDAKAEVEAIHVQLRKMGLDPSVLEYYGKELWSVDSNGDLSADSKEKIDIVTGGNYIMPDAGEFLRGDDGGPKVRVIAI